MKILPRCEDTDIPIYHDEIVEPQTASSTRGIVYKKQENASSIVHNIPKPVSENVDRNYYQPIISSVRSINMSQSSASVCTISYRASTPVILDGQVQQGPNDIFDMNASVK